MSRTPPPPGPCAGKTSLFFPTSINTAADRARMNAALKLCGICPNRQQCLDYALEYEPFGIWGGTSARERERMRRKLGIRLKHHETILVRGDK